MTIPTAAAARAATGSAWLVIIAASITVAAWASAFVAIRGVRESFEPGALALGRLLIGGFALTAALLVRRRWVRPSAREWGLVVACGVAWFTTSRSTAPSNASMPAPQRCWSTSGRSSFALLAGALLGEGFPRWLLIGAGVAFAGAVLIATTTAEQASSDLEGVLLCLLAAATWAIGVTAQKPVLRRLPALQVTQMACTIGALACLPFAGQLLSAVGNASEGALAGLIYLGAVPTALAFGTWAYALSRMDAGRLGVTTYLVPPLTILAAWPLLDETPPPLALVGGLLALAGIALARRRE